MSRSDEFERLYRTYYGRLYRFFLRHGVLDDLARDLAQDVFVRIYQRMDQYRGEASEWTYLQTIARRILVDQVRMHQASKRAGSTISFDAVPFAALMLSVTPDPLAEMVMRQQDEQLQAAIQDLPDRMRVVLQLFLEGLSYEEITKALHISNDAVKSRLRDAKRRLRERLGASRELLDEN